MLWGYRIEVQQKGVKFLSCASFMHEKEKKKTVMMTGN